jgi:tetratricopeptide (TPR) repeat protein
MMGRLDPSAAEFRRALELKPEYALAHNNLGNVLLMQGKPAEALTHFREAVRIDPANVEAHYNLGSMARGRGDLAEAVGQFREAIALKTDSGPALAGLAWILAAAPDAALRDPNEAVRLSERMADMTGRHDAGVLDLLAAAYAAAGDFDRAVATEQAALDLKPPDAIAATMRTRQAMYAQHRPYISP